MIPLLRFRIGSSRTRRLFLPHHQAHLDVRRVDVVVVFFLVDANDDDFCPPFLFVGVGDGDFLEDDGLLLRLDERVARAEEPAAAIVARVVAWWC